MFVACLQAIDHPQHLRSVSPRARGIAQDQANRLLRIDDIHASDGQRHALGVHIGCVLIVDHVVQQGNLALLVANDGELEVRAGDFVDVLDPAVVGVDRISGEADQLDIAFGEFGLEFGEGAEFCEEVGWSFAFLYVVSGNERVWEAVLTSGADRCEILWVRENDGPAIADPFVKVFDGAIGSLC